MNTIVYLIRHSEKLDMQYIDRYYDDENYQITREKRILSADRGTERGGLLQRNGYREDGRNCPTGSVKPSGTSEVGY